MPKQSSRTKPKTKTKTKVTKGTGGLSQFRNRKGFLIVAVGIAVMGALLYMLMAKAYTYTQVYSGNNATVEVCRDTINAEPVIRILYRTAASAPYTRMGTGFGPSYSNELNKKLNTKRSWSWSGYYVVPPNTTTVRTRLYSGNTLSVEVAKDVTAVSACTTTVAPPPPTSTTPTKYEAEQAETNATVMSGADKSYASGGAVIGLFGEQGKYVTFTVTAPVSANYPITLAYAAADGSGGLDPLPRTQLVNGGFAKTVNFPRTSKLPDDWNTIKEIPLGEVALKAGQNKITFRIDISGYNYWDVDYLLVTGTTQDNTTPTNPPAPDNPPVVSDPPPTGVGGSGASMTPGRKCAAGTTGATTVSAGGNLQTAVDKLPNGGTLVVNAGTYGPVTVNGRTNLTICGAIGSRPIIKVTGQSAFVFANSSHIHVEGFEVIGTSNANETGFGAVADSHHIHIWDNWVHDLGGFGIGGANAYCGHIDFRYNKIWNTSMYNSYHMSAISVYEPRNCGGGADVGIYSDFIIGNIVYNNGEKISGATDGNCIIWDDTLDRQGLNQTEGPYLGRVLIANNLCVANGARGIQVGPTSARADIVNNTIYHNFNPAFTVPQTDRYSGDLSTGWMSDDIRVINNVSIARPGLNGFDLAGGTNVLKSNNIFNAVSRDDARGGYLLLADPGFVNPGYDPNNADFRPRSGSPMINGGTGSYADVIIPRVDITGKTRSATTPSIGAYEQ